MRNITLNVVCALALLIPLLFCQSCEDDSATESSISVSPGYAELHEGESVTLTATGWDTYNWSLAEPSWGTLSRSTGDSVTYTATRDSDENGTSVNQTVTVVAASTGIASTNSASVPSARATLRHIY